MTATDQPLLAADRTDGRPTRPPDDPPRPVIRVLLADDETLVRAGLAAILTGEPDLAVVAEAGDGDAALQAIRAHRPDVVLMDIRMPGLDGIHATRRIAADPWCAGTRVIMLTTFDLDEYVYAALRAGASGFLVKHTEPAELLHAIRVVHGGEALLSPSVTRRLIAEFAARVRPPDPNPAMARLTEREREVLALVAQGHDNTDIARLTRITPATAKTHVSRVMAKLGAHDRAQLVVIAYETGLALPGWLAQDRNARVAVLGRDRPDVRLRSADGQGCPAGGRIGGRLHRLSR
jgi:DNA-binding NarL/FixJ family response regulator